MMMKRFLLLGFGAFTVSMACSQPFQFVPDTGIRIDNAATRHVRLIHDTMFLYYGQQLDTNGSVFGLAISTDAPDYLHFQKVDLNDYPLHNFHTLPNGIKRRYTYNMAKQYVESETSLDGYTAQPDTGSRYNLDPSDNHTFGVSTVYNDTSGRVHLLYMGDMTPGGADNIRHAVSVDTGWTFTFWDNDVCGDLNLQVNSHTHWDPFAIPLPNQAICLFTMNPHGKGAPPANPTGTIYTFLSTDNGHTFQIDIDPHTGDSARLHYNDFTSLENTSLNDPKAVVLPDGRMKLYVNGLVKGSDNNYTVNILSATLPLEDLSQVPVAETSTALTIFPNPATIGGSFYIKAAHEAPYRLSIYRADGKLVRSISQNIAGLSTVDLSGFASGLYLVLMELDQGQQALSKLLILPVR